MLGERVLLLYQMRGKCGIIPPHTMGTICGVARGVPQVDFGRHGVKNIAPHYVVRVDVPDGCPLPEDGYLLDPDDLSDTLFGLIWDQWAISQRQEYRVQQLQSMGLAIYRARN